MRYLLRRGVLSLGGFCLMVSLSAVGVQAAEDRAQPNLREPGPDTPDFPDSAFAVPLGVTYLETSLTQEKAKDIDRTRTLSTATLLRYGIAPNWELRLSSDGWLRERSANGRRSGVGDLAVGFKRHFSAEKRGRPAMGLIAQVKLPTGASAFSNGKTEAFASLNFDKTLPGDVELEWNIGMSWLAEDGGGHFIQGNLLWVLGKKLNDRWGVFVDGFADVPSAPGERSVAVVGPGVSYFVNDRMAIDVSVHCGLTKESPHRIVRLGLQFAY
jgi:hypothetical protein